MCPSMPIRSDIREEWSDFSSQCCPPSRNFKLDPKIANAPRHYHDSQELKETAD